MLYWKPAYISVNKIWIKECKWAYISKTERSVGHTEAR